MNSGKPKMVILADIGSLRVTCVGFKALLADLSQNFEVVACKFYSYVAKRNRDYNEFIAAYGYETYLPSASRRRNKLDSRQVITATEIANSNTMTGIGINAVAFITGEGDILPVINLLKSKGIDVYELNVAKTKYSDVYSDFIQVPLTALRQGYTAPATKVKKAPKPVVAPAGPHDNQRLQDVKNILSKYRK
ncbi:MAG: NYN domain-containing protein [Christensenellaceae bacterium]|jgi:hypothetical protein|nr:NYN domain-containing protein [Christensenellaceae bacterium]